MEIVASRPKEEPRPRAGIDDYRESVRQLIEAEVRNALEEEMKKAAQEILEEQRKAIRDLVEEHKKAIRQVVDEEKKNIWVKAEELRASILKVGLY